MATRVVGLQSSNTDEAARQWLAYVDDEILGCRGQSHNWPKLRPGKPRRGVRIVGPYVDGVMEIVQTCADCGKTRRLITAPHGVLDLPARWGYKDPRTRPGHEPFAAPKGSGITRRQCLEETWRRAREDLLAHATPPADQG